MKPNTLGEQSANPSKTEYDWIRLVGGTPLQGSVEVKGAKNSLPKLMVAAVLTDKPCHISNVAQIVDVDLVADLIRAHGGLVHDTTRDSIEIAVGNPSLIQPDELGAFAGKSRIPVLLCGPLLARLGEAIIPSLGGCQIGPRPVDFHLKALVQLGATVEEKPYGLHLRAKRLRGAQIRLEYPSVGATEQVLLASVMAEGVTQLSNAAVEPEILDLISVLQKMGAVISIETDRVINISGVDQLCGFSHHAITDRLEVASWACAALVTDGHVEVRNANQLEMMTFLNRFRQVGGGFEIKQDSIAFWKQSEDLKSIALETDVHPGFMTDWQQPFVVVLTQTKGVSVVHETVYENRFGYIDALNKMGAQIQLYQECLGSHKCRFGQRNFLHSAVIVGPSKLRGGQIHIPDLRGGFSYVISGLAAEGESMITNMRLMRRGYDNFIGKLRSLGANILEVG